MGFTKPQHELRRQLLDLIKQQQEIEFTHKQNRHEELGKMLGIVTTKTQFERAIGKLHSLGAISASHKVVYVAGVATRRHVLRFNKDVEL